MLLAAEGHKIPHAMESNREPNDKRYLALFRHGLFKSLPWGPGISPVINVHYFDSETPLVYHDIYFFQLDSIIRGEVIPSWRGSALQRWELKSFNSGFLDCSPPREYFLMSLELFYSFHSWIKWIMGGAVFFSPSPPRFYGEIIDTSPCLSVRHAAWEFDLHVP